MTQVAMSATPAGVRAPTRRALARLSRFPRRVRPAVSALASRDGRFADLALSFPALLVALAIARRSVDVARARALVSDGAPLRAVAGLARVPIWLKALPPESFLEPLAELPDGPQFRLQIANFVPGEARFSAAWLAAVAQAHEAGNANFVLWVARKSPRQRYPDGMVHRLALLAWYSGAGRSTSAGGYISKAWHPAMSWDAACMETYDWFEAIMLALRLKNQPLVDPWIGPQRVLGYDFVPLVTMGDIIDEAAAMGNCVRTYGLDLAAGSSRLFSVRCDGRRIATLELGMWQDDPYPRIGQLRGPRNLPVTQGVWQAAHRWLVTHAQPRSTCADCCAPLDPRVWRDLWRPYWLAHGRVPRWLPLQPLRSLNNI